MISFILCIVLFFYARSLSNRIESLENQIRNLKQKSATPLAATITPKAVSSSDNTPTTKEPASAIKKPEVYEGHNSLIDWLKEDWMLKLGAFLVIIGFAWLAVYALPYIGQTGRIVSGLVVGALIMAFGTWRIQAYIQQGGVFVIIGVAAVLLTLYADHSLGYGVFNDLVAIGVMFLTTLYVSILGVVYRKESLAIAGLSLSALVPFLIGSEQADYVMLFSYLFLVVVSSIWVVFATNWQKVHVIALTITILYSVPVWTGFTIGDVTKFTLLIFAFIFSALFFVATIATTLRDIHQDEDSTPSVVSIFLNAAYIGVSVYAFAHADYQAILYITLALVTALATFLIFSYIQKSYLFIGHGIASLAFLGIATAKLFSGPVLTIAFIVEVAFFIIAVAYLTRKLEMGKKLLYLASFRSHFL